MSGIKKANEVYFPTDKMIQNVFSKTMPELDSKNASVPKNLHEVFPKKSSTTKINVLLLSTTSSARKTSPEDKYNVRPSTSEWSLKHIKKHLDKNADITSVIVRLNDLEFSACEGNYSKEKNLCSWPCQITLRKGDADELNVVYYGLVDWADVVIVATPIRYGQPSALYYKMVERLTCVHNQLTLNDYNLIMDKVAAFVITGGQDNIQAVAGAMMLFWSELGFTFAGHSYVGWSRGWNNEEMDSNYESMINNQDYETDLLRMANDAVEMRTRLMKSRLPLNRPSPTSYSEYEVKRHQKQEHEMSLHPLIIEEERFISGKHSNRYKRYESRSCVKDDILSGNQKIFNVEGRPIVVARIGDKFNAFDGICTHARVQLDSKELEKEGEKYLIECKAHSAFFDAMSGKVTNAENFAEKYGCTLENLKEYELVIDNEGKLFVKC